jgi:uncharacterized protein (TIGR02246 family)
MRKPLAVALVPALIAGCSPMRPATTAPEPSIARNWAAALNDCNVDALVALYHPDALFWPTTSRALSTNPGDIRSYYDVACSMARASGFKVGIASESVKVHSDTVVSAGVAIGTLTNRQGQTQTGSIRFSVTARRVDGKWLIVEHHSSGMPAQTTQ